MLKRLLTILFVMSLAGIIAYRYSSQSKSLPKIKFSLPASLPSIVQIPVAANDVINQLNLYRTENKMLALKENDKLDKAALARLSVIQSNTDYDGSLTGLTLINSVKNNNYAYSIISDYYASDFTSVAKLIENWQKDNTAQKTLNEKSFRDVGIALSREGNSLKVYLILARPMTAVVQPTGAGGYPHVSWGGPELWAAVNKRRQELGVNPLSQKEELCTIASIRLNQLLELGKLDGHAGLDPTLNRPDLVWIKNKYNIAEFLVVGYPTPKDTVSAWEHTLGHRELLSGGQYVWGCVYSQDTFGVAIAAY